jgi:hypothetical protein
MPAKSAAQQRLFGAALGAKRGAKTFPLAQKIAGQMSEPQLIDMTKAPKMPRKPPTSKMANMPKMPQRIKVPKVQSYL